MEQFSKFEKRRLQTKLYTTAFYSMGDIYLESIHHELPQEVHAEKGLIHSKYKLTKKQSDVIDQENKNRSIRRAKQNFRRIVLSNLNRQNFLFLTLTFAENLTDLDRAYLKLKIFLKQVRQYESIKYMGVFEYQKRGAIHFHIFIFNLDWLPKNILDKWRKPNGFLKVKAIYPSEHIKTASYLTKYFNKSYELIPKGRKRYFSSRNLTRPIKYFLNYDDLLTIDLKQYKIYNTFKSEKTDDKIIYKQYERL